MKDSVFYTVIILLVFIAGCVVGLPGDFSLSALANLASIISAFITLAALAFAVRTVNTWKKPLQIEIVLEEALKAREVYSFLTALSVDLFDAIDDDIAHKRAALTRIGNYLGEKSELIPQLSHSRFTLTHKKSEALVQLEKRALGINFALYDLEVISQKIQDDAAKMFDGMVLRRLKEIRKDIDAFIPLVANHRAAIESHLVRLSEHASH